MRSFVPGWRQLVSAALLVHYLLACTSWRVQGPTPEAAIQRAPSKVRLTQTDHSTLVLHNPKLVADSVTGQLDSTGAMIRTVALPLTAITAVSVRRLNLLKTTAAVLGGLLLFSLLSCAATQCLEIKPSQ